MYNCQQSTILNTILEQNNYCQNGYTIGGSNPGIRDPGPLYCPVNPGIGKVNREIGKYLKQSGVST